MTKEPAVIRLQPLVRERTWEREEFPLLRLKLSVPHCVGTDPRLRRINRYYDAFARSCERYARRFLLPAAADAFALAMAEHREAPPWTITVSFTTTLLTARWFSLTLEMEERHESVCERRRYGDTWDLREGYPLALSALFPDEPHLRRRLTRAARETLLCRENEGVLHERWRRRLLSAWNRERFFLTPEGVHWFYPQYALGGEALGIPTFFLPWSEEGTPRLPRSDS